MPFFSIIVTGLPCRANSVTDAFSRVRELVCLRGIRNPGAGQVEKIGSALVGDGIAVGCAVLIGFVHGIRQTGQNRRCERLAVGFGRQGR